MLYSIQLRKVLIYQNKNNQELNLWVLIKEEMFLKNNNKN